MENIENIELTYLSINDYQELKKQLQTSPNKSLVGKAMMKNLEIQLQMISQQLYIINQVNQYKKEEKTFLVHY